MRAITGLLSLSLLTLACGGDETSTVSPGPTGGGAAGAAGTGAQAGGAGTSGAAGQAGAAGAAGSAAAGAAGKSGGAGVGGAAGSAGTGNGGAGGAGVAGVGGAGGAAGEAGSGGSAGNGAAGSGGAGVGGAAGNAGAGGALPCGGCQGSFLCKYDVCVPDLGACTTNGDCPGDSYCDTDGSCVPYGVPSTKVNDPTCKKEQVPGAVTPQVQCEWSGPAAGDPTAKLTEIYSTPIVADLNLDLDPNKLQPSIIVTTFDFDQADRTGMLRVFDGRTCAEQMRIGGPDDPKVGENRPGYAVTWAVGDLDGDVGTPNGHPEIVGLHRVGLSKGTDPVVPIAFSIDTTDPAHPKLVKKWEGRNCQTNQAIQIASNASNLGVSIKDIDDDGRPEILCDKFLFDADGCLLNAATPALNNGIGEIGVISTYADVDLDGVPELVRYDGVFSWDATARDWVRPSWAKASLDLTAAYVAVADFGEFSTLMGAAADARFPEIVVVANGKARIQTIGGDVVFGPFDVVDGGRGGPPTAADFDGDGQVEFATAGSKAYTVYDPDCAAGADPAKRPGGTCSAKAGSPNGVLWSQPSQDQSSNITGSSVFDFDGDGQSEVVYRDECYLRVYKGQTGEVVYSAPASSGTGVEYPTIVDVDGDFATEIVVSRTSMGGCPSPDPLNAASGPFVQGTGFVILRDPKDRWASSRPIWNEHAYYVTNVTDDGRIPKTSEEKHNWTEVGLNNFRTNVQGGLGGLKLADLTVEIQDTFNVCNATGATTLTAKVCNRGTNPVQDGATVSFDSVLGQDASPLCTSVTTTLLAVGACTEVSCTGDIPAGHDVLVTVDPENAIADCHPGNNVGASARVLCGKD
jgi:hypothetical protein